MTRRHHSVARARTSGGPGAAIPPVRMMPESAGRSDRRRRASLRPRPRRTKGRHGEERAEIQETREELGADVLEEQLGDRRARTEEQRRAEPDCVARSHPLHARQRTGAGDRNRRRVDGLPSLLVTNDFPPKIGGIQSYLYELWRRLPPEATTVLTTPHAGRAGVGRGAGVPGRADARAGAAADADAGAPHRRAGPRGRARTSSSWTRRSHSALSVRASTRRRGSSCCTGRR